METYTDPDNDGLEKVMHGDEDQDIVIDAEHSSREVDLEGDGESVTGVCVRTWITAFGEFSSPD